MDNVEGLATDRPRDRRRRSAGRPNRLTPRFTDDELSEIAAAAAREGRTITGFCADAALAAARGATTGGPGSEREALRQLQLEMFAARTAVNKYGTNVNQVAAAFNATGELPEYAAAAILLCRRAVERLDAVTASVRRRLR